MRRTYCKATTIETKQTEGRLCEQAVALELLKLRSSESNVHAKRGRFYTRQDNVSACQPCDGNDYAPIVGSCTTISTYVFLVNSSSTAVNSGSSISIATKSSRTLEHEYLKALMSSDVRSYRVGAILCGSVSLSELYSE